MNLFIFHVTLNASEGSDVNFDSSTSLRFARNDTEQLIVLSFGLNEVDTGGIFWK